MTRRSFMAKAWRDPRLAWLSAEITDVEAEARKLAGVADQVAARCLAPAREACRRHDLNSGWAHLYRARQEMIMTYDVDRLRICARALHEEIKDPDRLPAWRLKAIRGLLSETGFTDCGAPAATDPGIDSRRRLVVEAIKLRNEGVSNDYWRLAVVRHYQATLLIVGAPVLALVVYLLTSTSRSLFRQDWSASRVSCVLAVLLGILGAVSSAAQRSTRIKRERVTVQLGSYASSFSRIPIGAVAGLTIWLFSVATANATSINAPNLLLAAFGAGFAERLIVQGHVNDQSNPPPAAEAAERPPRR
ncbi:hypothetical protein [Actinoplanes sp. NPDC049265]|uniref:hypothetical protein n=1 Tax=Actinoplanes sp. NPDC049265 TaxID=3363902 RepID=UPI00371109FC